jgi:hypothetical protein
MSKQFFYEIVVEVPRGLMKQSDLVGQDFSEKAIALDLARDVALKTETASPFPAIGKTRCRPLR